MWNITYNLKRHLSLEKKGYEFIKTINLYIPHIEIGLNVLVRKEQQLSFFSEIILKLINGKCSAIANISELTGVEEEIVNDVVGGMSNLDLIYIRSGSLILTPQGEAALKTLKETLIEKEELNRVIINAITGKIVELENPLKKPSPNSPCLDEKIKINIEFIGNYFNDFNEYYQKRQEDFGVEDANGIARNEIYQILSKTYEKLCYSEKTAYVYKNVKDNDLIFECENDKDNIYASLLASQIHTSTGARNFLENKFNTNRYLNKLISIDKTMEQNTEQLIEYIKNDNFSKNINTDEFEKVYFVDRYLLENEYLDILSFLKNIKPSEVLISSCNLSLLLNDNVVGSLLASVNNSNTKITILCDKNDRKRNGHKFKLLEQNQKKKDLIKWVECEDIFQTKIVLYPFCTIKVDYLPIEVGKDYLIKEIAEISFGKEDAENALKNLI